MYTILQCSQHKYADRHFRKLILLYTYGMDSGQWTQLSSLKLLRILQGVNLKRYKIFLLHNI